MLPFAANSDARTQMLDIYQKLYQKGLYKDTWFNWKGKPLILAYPECLQTSNALDKEIRNFFTFRRDDPLCFHTTMSNDYWGWLSRYPQAVYKTGAGKVEEVTVGVTQNLDYERNVLTAMSGYNVMGRSYTKGSYNYTYLRDGRDKVVVDKNIANSKYYGLNFQQQWDYAISQDPEFIFVTGWNEWVAMRMETWAGDTTLTNCFVDQFNTEYSRDVEPSQGEMKDYYYYQLVENIRRFKGVSDTAPASPSKTIDIAGKLSQWSDVPGMQTYVGSTIERSKSNGSTGYGGKIYKNKTARNDIALVKTAYDDSYVYFYAECADEITPSTDEGWMRLFIDTGSSDKAWEGFEYVINRNSPSDGKAAVERSKGGWSFEIAGSADIVVRRNIIQLRVPREALGLSKGGVPASFGYKWTDNNMIGENEGNVLNLYTDGETAPGGRFCFPFK